MTGLAKRIVVVVVDDNSKVRESVGSLVESAGYTALVFSSAEEFLQSGDLQAANCLITDVRMPGMNGLELQRRVRLELPRLPVIFISGHDDDEARQRAFEQGAACFLYKPFNAADLLPAIQIALSKSREDRLESSTND